MFVECKRVYRLYKELDCMRHTIDVKIIAAIFCECDVMLAKQIGDLFGFQRRTNAALCKKWVESSFLEIVDYSNKARKYKLSHA